LQFKFLKGIFAAPATEILIRTKSRDIKMKKLLLVFCITMLSIIFVLAQTADDFHKGEFSASFSNNQVDTGFSDDNDVFARFL